MAIEKTKPRGLRNHNPLNIRRSSDMWQGMADAQTDKEFVQFKADVYGLRAAFIILRKYIKQYRLDTVEKIIHRWAPPSENNVQAYVNAVYDFSYLDRGQTIRWDDKDAVTRLVWAMSRVECGEYVSFGVVNNAYAMANRK